jgi:hypothetical protein
MKTWECQLQLHAWRMHYIPGLPCKLPLYYLVLDMLMLIIDVHITENVHGRIHTFFRLNQEIHQDVNEQYPKFYEGTSKFDYDQAIHVMTHGNSVTVKELCNHHFPSGKCLW